jgi:HK97 family phage portal protein
VKLRRGPGIFDRALNPITWTSIYGDDYGPASAFGTMRDHDDVAFGRSYTGRRISERTALNYSAVYACVTLIADAISSLPPEAIVEPPDGGPIKIAPLPQWIKKPHPELRRNEVWNQLLLSMLLWGNGYALIIRRPSDGVPIGLRPLDPTRVHSEWDIDRPGFRRYMVDGGPWLTSQDIFHVMGPTLPGWPYGMSVIRHAREAIGLGLTLEEYGARYFAQGSMAKVVITVPNKQLGTEQARDIVNMYERFHRGPGNWHRPAVLSGGGTIQNISIPPEDAQFLESREFQATEITRWFRVPPHRVSIISKQSSWGSGLAEENTAMVQNTFRPWIMRLEAAFTAYAPGGEDSGMRIRLNDSSLLRGSFQEQVDAWTKAVTGLVATPNEARKALGLDPVEGGDDLLKAIKPANEAVPGDVIPADPNAGNLAPPKKGKGNANEDPTG